LILVTHALRLPMGTPCAIIAPIRGSSLRCRSGRGAVWQGRDVCLGATLAGPREGASFARCSADSTQRRARQETEPDDLQGVRVNHASRAALSRCRMIGRRVLEILFCGDVNPSNRYCRRPVRRGALCVCDTGSARE
jgi:hypothetical protein